MIRNTHYTLSEAFELIGRRLHGDEWTGGESGISTYCSLTEDDIAIRRTWTEKVVEPSRFPGAGEPDSAAEQMAHLLARARDEQTEPINIVRLVVWAEMSAHVGPEEEIHPLLVDNRARARLDNLLMDAQHESLRKLRSGSPLSEVDCTILDELEKEYHTLERRESVMLWITNHAWSGDGSDAALTGYTFTPDDGKTAPLLPHCWGARSFALTLYNDKATMDDQPWPADGVLVFLKKQLDAVLGTAQAALPMTPTPAGAADPAPSAVVGRPTAKAKIQAAYQDLRDAGQIDFNDPRIRLYEPIRRKVQEHTGDPSLEGLQNEAIRKAIRPLFEQDKNKRPVSP